MAENEQYEGFLIRHWADGDILVLVLEDFQDVFPPDLSEVIREVTIIGIDPRNLDREGLKKSEGDDLWITVNKDAVELAANFMPQQTFRMAKLRVTKRAYDISDLLALYKLMRSAVNSYRESYGVECRKVAELQARIANFIATRRNRLAAKLEFFAEKDTVKAARFRGMLAVLDDLGREFK